MGLDYSNHPQMLHAATKEKTGLPETEGLKLFHSLTVFLYSTWLLRLFNVVYKGIIDDHTLQCLFQQVFFLNSELAPNFWNIPSSNPSGGFYYHSILGGGFKYFQFSPEHWGNDPI